MKKIDAVLAAIKNGCNTSKDVADVTGMNSRNCAGLLRYLARVNKIRKTDRFINHDGKGRPARVFEPLRGI